MNKKSVSDDSHIFSGFEEYSYIAQDGYAYIWDEDHIIGELRSGYKWDDIFIADPYMKAAINESTNSLVNFPALIRRSSLFLMEVDKRKKNYVKFIKNNFEPKNSSISKMLSESEAYRNLIREQFNLQINKLEEIDAHFRKVLKVICYETEKRLLKEDITQTSMEDQLTLNMFYNGVNNLYRIGFREICSLDEVLKFWVPRCINCEYSISDLKKKHGKGHGITCLKPDYMIPEAMVISLINAIHVLVPKKEKMLSSLLPHFQKLYHIETLRYFILNDLSVIGKEQEFPELVNISELEKYDTNYFETAIKIQEDQNLKSPEVYKIMNEKRSQLSLPHKPISLNAFKSGLSQYKKGSYEKDS